MLTHMPQVDGLRAVALLGVMLAHFLPLNAGVLNFGLFGVSIFFCLSGYLITTSLLSIRDQRFRLRWSVTIRETYLRRWVRLTIPLYVCLAGGFLLNIHPVRASWSWHALYLSNLYMTLTGDWQGRTIHFWYLAVDCQVFLLWPWFILYTPKRALLPALISLVCVAPLLRLTMTLAGANVQAQDALPLFWVAPIALGAILAVRPTIRLSVFWPMALAAAFGFRLAYGHLTDQPLETLEYLLMVLGTTWLTWAVVMNRFPRLTALLQSKPFVLVGAMSYSIYLWHEYADEIIQNLPSYTLQHHAWLRFAAKMAVASTLGVLAWWFVERPLRNVLLARRSVRRVE